MANEEPVELQSESKTATVSASDEFNLAKKEMQKTWTTELRQPYRPATRRDNYEERKNPNESLDSVVRFSCDRPLLENGHVERPSGVYRSTTTKSEASAASAKKSYGRVSEVYSNSEDTIIFAHNLGAYLTSVIPPFVWIGLFTILALWGLALLLVGAFNIPYCSLQPMIPVYLIVTGCLFITFAAIRIYSLWPMPENSRSNSLGIDLACRGVEGLVIMAILVWLILGSIWTFGGPKQSYVHYERGHYQGTYMANHYCDQSTYWMALISIFVHITIIGFGVLGIIMIILLGGIWVYGKRHVYHPNRDMFEQHYCDSGTYWTAYTSVSLHLAMIALIILIAFLILMFGLWKEINDEKVTTP